MSNEIDKIRDAYEQARQAQRRARDTSAPAWESLPLAVREAIIEVFFAGRRDAHEEDGKR
jgi:hypothetical protein